MAVAPDGAVHIGFIGVPESGWYDLRHAASNGSGWETEVVDEYGIAGRYPSLQLDDLGLPRIGYRDDTRGLLAYTFHDGTTWHKVIADSVENRGKNLSLALDAEGEPHISHNNADGSSPTNLWHTYRENGVWHTATVQPGSRVHGGTSLAVDSQGRSHFCYSRYTGGDYRILYARWDGEVSIQEEFDPSAFCYHGDFSIAVDGADRAQIAYYDESHGWLKWARRTDEGWHVEVVDYGGNVGLHVSLALDADGWPHLAYQAEIGDLKYARRTDDGWQVEIVDSGNDVGWFTSIGLTTDGHPVISYRDATTGYLKAAWKSGEEWHAELIAYGGNVDLWFYKYGTSLKIDPDNTVLIAFYDSDDEDLKLARGTGSLGARDDSPRIEDFTLRLLGPVPTPGLVRLAIEAHGMSRVRASVCNVMGRTVHTLFDGCMAPGTHELSWNGVGASGHRLESGTYVIVARVGDRRGSMPLVVLR
ncbi:MAG: hypothetical protein MUE60_07835 [Candidatus Eisenbacteria bacterium]|nr:hypothetical protein [Candidatus Eisenbacteria bacterium]